MTTVEHTNSFGAQQKPSGKPEAPAGNAIYVNRKLLSKLRSALSKGMGPFDKLPPDRDIIDAVVAQMFQVFKDNPVYSVLPEDPEPYKYFGSQYSAYIGGLELRDKGRFVDACIIAYLSGESGVQRYCTAGRVIRPRRLEEGKRRRIEQTAAEMAASKDVDSVFDPCSSTEL